MKPVKFDECPSGQMQPSIPQPIKDDGKKPIVCFVSTIAWPLKVYLEPHFRKISETCQVFLVAQDTSVLTNEIIGPSYTFIDIKINRRISLFSDFLALFRLWFLFRRERFTCVHSIMPKSGLLAMVAATLAGVPIRFHTFTGQVWVTQEGMWRRFLMLMDWLIAQCATQILTDGFSQRDLLIAERIVKPDKIEVLGGGSIVGVDTNRFSPNKAARNKIRFDFGIAESAIVFIFVGRINKDKGIDDLLKSFENISELIFETHLLIVGPDEDNYYAKFDKFNVELRNKIHHIAFTSRPEYYMAGADICCLPSYREGFGSVLIETAAVGLPAVASRIYGITDAVVDQVTGILHEPGNIQEISQSMLKLALDKPLRRKMGDAARMRVIQEFSQERLTTAFETFYRKHGVLA